MSYEELVELLNRHCYNYYVLDNPTISDSEYDKLFDLLLKTEQESGYISPSSPSRKVGGEPIKEFERHTHLSRLYSLDKAQSKEELIDWYNGILKTLTKPPILSVDYKLDGLTLSLTYENGKFKGASTRGDGTTGEDITAQVLTIKTLPLTIPVLSKVEIQGEGIMRLSRFREYNKTADEPLKNARNGAAGAIRNLDPKVTASRKLDVIAYSINYMDEPFVFSQREMSEWLKKAGFFTLPPKYCSTIEEVIKVIDSVDRSKLDFLTDGMVVKVDDVSERKKLGYTDRFPKWAVAYKFEAEEGTTTLLNAEWNVGRSGKVTPLAVLEPIELCGVTVSRATLNNAQDIRRKKVKIGSRVFVRRSGDVIPEIMGVSEVHEDDVEIATPDKCPGCGSGLTEVGAHIFCVNPDCPPKVISNLEYFSSKDCMDIDGFSTATAEMLYNVMNIDSPHKLYSLKTADLLMLEGFKQKKAESLISAIEKSKIVTLDRFICALGIPNVGKKTAKDLADIYGSIDALSKAGYEELTEISDVGPAIAKSIVSFFKSEAEYIEKLLDAGIIIKAKEIASQKLAGKKFVLTGTLPSMPRSGMISIIEQNGGRVQASVSKETDYLIAGDGGGAKADKAKKLGISILSESAFLKMLE